jgi:hypothetical protein
VTILPTPAPSTAAQWVFDDYQQDYDVSPAAAGGTCQIAFGPVPEDQLWLLERVTVSCNSSTASSCTLYADVVDPSRALDYTPTGNFDVADESCPIQLETGTTLLVVWSAASAGAKGTARVQYRILRRASGGW